MGFLKSKVFRAKNDTTVACVLVEIRMELQ